MYRSILFWTVACTLVLAAGCSSGDGGGDESTEDVGTDVVADVTPDTDSPSDVAREDVRDGGGEADVRSRDVADVEGGDGGEDGEETDPGAAGEPCAEQCGSTPTVGWTRCEYCNDGWCFTPPDDGEPYCTRRCDSQADCDELGDGWECDAHGQDLCSNG